MNANPLKQASDIRCLPEMFARAAEKYPNQASFITRQENSQVFSGPTFQELYQQGRDLAAALILQLNIRKGEHVGLISENRLEWMRANYAIQMAAAVTVPRGRDITDFEIEYIFNHAEIQTCFVENLHLAQRIQKLKSQLKHLKNLIILEKDSDSDGKTHAPEKNIYQMQQLQTQGQQERTVGTVEQEIQQRIGSLMREDIFTLLYTSGTTGNPKGVMLSHHNMLCGQLENPPFLFDFRKDILLSILPIWHAFELVVEMLAIYCGTTTAYTNIRTIKEDLTLVQPTFMASAPRLWESIYNGLIKRVNEGSAIKRALFQGAVKSSAVFYSGLRKISRQDMTLHEKSLPHMFVDLLVGILQMIIAAFPYVLLDALVFSKVRKALGGRLQQTISGGGALPPYIDDFFNQLGIKVLEGYGLTETSPVVAVRTLAHRIIGTVGRPLLESEIRIQAMDDSNKTLYQTKSQEQQIGIAGVVHVRGPLVMKGYYKDAAETSRVLDKDGWFNTGDIGMMVLGGALRILGRVKDTIVLSNGENVEPVPIENKLLQSPYVHQCMLVGQDKKNIAALIVVDAEQCKIPDRKQINENQEIRKLIRTEIQSQIHKDSRFRDFERIVHFVLLEDEFTVGAELTASFKVKRHVVQKKFQEMINQIYL